MDPITLGLGATGLAALISYLTKSKKEGDVITGVDPQMRSMYTPGQEQAQNQLLQQLGPLLQQSMQGANQDQFQNIANKEMTRFQTQTVPSLAERFVGMGGALKSGGFEGVLGRAGAGLSENLAALGAQYGLNQQSQRLDLLKALMTSGFSPSQTWQEAQPGLVQNVLGMAAPSLSAYYGAKQGQTNALSDYLAKQANSTGNMGKINSMLQGQMAQDNFVPSLLAQRPTSTSDFFKTSGIVRG